MTYIPGPSEEELLASIKPDMRLTKSFIKRIYGYGVTNPDFPDKAISALEAAGCSKARAYYEDWVAEYQAAHDKEMKKVAKWYSKECEKEFEKMKKGSEEKRKQLEKESLRQMSNKDLIELLESLTGAI